MLVGQRLGLLGQPLRRLEVGRARWPASGRASRRRRARVRARGRPRGRRRPRRARSGVRAGARGPAERQWKPNEPSIAPTTNAVSASPSPAAATRGRQRCRGRRSGARARPRPAEVARGLVAEADQQDEAQGGVAGEAADRYGDDLAAGAARLARLEHRQQVDPERLAGGVRPGPEDRRAVVGGERVGDSLHAGELVREKPAQCERRRRDLGRKRRGGRGHLSPRRPSGRLPVRPPPRR